MDPVDDEEFFFRAPVEEMSELSAAAGDVGGGEHVRNLQHFVNRDLLQTASRLALQTGWNRRQEKAPNSLSNGEGQKPAQVAALLRKLNSVDAFDEGEISLPYWRALVFLCSTSENSTAAFVKNGGIAVVVRTMHDFMVRRAELGEPALLIITEILRCLAAVSASSYVNFDVDWISDILGTFIDLNECALVEQISKPTVFKGKIVGDFYRADQKYLSKLSTFLPASKDQCEATDVDAFTSSSDQLLIDYAPRADFVNIGEIWTLKQIVHISQEQPIISNGSLSIITKINPVTFVVRHSDWDDRLIAVYMAFDTSLFLEQEKYNRRPNIGSLCLLPREAVTYPIIDASIRVLVTSFCDDDFTKVAIFAIDYGFISDVPWSKLYHLPEAAKRAKPAAKICFLRDVVPSPNRPAFEAALIVLRNLSAHSLQTQPLLKRNIVEALLLILRLRGENTIVDSAVKVLTNLAFPCTEKRQLIVECGGLEQLFLLGSEIAETLDNDGHQDDTNLLQHVMECMANLLRFNSSGRQKFAEMNGLLLPNHVLSRAEKQSVLYQSAVSLTSAAFSDTVVSKEWEQHQKSWTDRNRSKNNCPQLSKLLMDALKVKYGKVSFDAMLTPGMLELCTPKPCPADSLKPNAEVGEVLERIAVPLSRGRYYSRGQKLELVDWSVISKVTDLHKLKARWMQELCCAALNTRSRLTIYFGLDDNGIVEGIQVTQWERDEFRVGIDWTLSRAFRPFLEPTMYNVEFVPVCVGDHQPESVPDLYVVELQIRHIATEAYQLEKDGAVFIRLNRQVIQLSLQEASEYFGRQIEEEKEASLKCLRRRVAMLKALMKKE